MQEEQVNLDIKQKMLEYAEGLESFAQDAGNFAQEEIPLVIQEYLTWMFAESIFWILVCGFFVAIIWIIRSQIEKGSKALILEGSTNRGDWKPESHAQFSFASNIVTWVITAGIAAISFQWMVWAVKIWVAPRVVILEKVMDLIQ